MDHSQSEAAKAFFASYLDSVRPETQGTTVRDYYATGYETPGFDEAMNAILDGIAASDDIEQALLDAVADFRGIVANFEALVKGLAGAINEARAA